MSGHPARVLALPGHTYFGAADLPWYVTVGMLLDGAESEGFDRVRVWAKEDFPLSFTPPRSDYSHVAIGRYFRSAERRIFLPKEVRWTYDVTGPLGANTETPGLPVVVTAPAAPPIKRPSALFLAGYYGALGALVLGGAWLARRAA